jgi:hypothetical protein
MEFENKYFLNIIKKIFIPIFFYSTLSPNFFLNKKRSNNILLRDYLFLDLLDIWLLIISRNLVLEPF